MSSKMGATGRIIRRISTFDVLRFSVVRTVAVLLAGTIPFASFFADHYVARSVDARLAAQPS